MFFPRLLKTKMKPYFFFSILILLFLMGMNKEAEANRLQQNYWKDVMGDETPIPDAIKDLLPSNIEGSGPVLHGANGDDVDSSSTQEALDLFNRDFDTKSVAIIYHHKDDNHE